MKNLNNDTLLSFSSIIPDPIWGNIPLTETEEKILNTQGFNRLRDLKQMGFAYLSFPGANHTRFGHSIGTMHVADQLFLFASHSVPDELRKNNFQFLRCRIAVRIAALLHDFGHPPFSHAMESGFKKHPDLLAVSESDLEKIELTDELKSIFENPRKYSHEIFTKVLIEEDEEIREILKEIGLHVTDVSRLAVGESSLEPFGLFRELISGDFDADRIDYLLRDNYYTGQPFRFSLEEFKGRIGFRHGSNTLYIRHEALPGFNSLLLARDRVIRTVHQDRKCRIADQMIIEEFNEFLRARSCNNPEQKVRLIIDIHKRYDDHTLTSELAKFEAATLNNDKRISSRQILSGKLIDEKAALTFEHMSPLLRACTHVININLGRASDLIRTRIKGLYRNLEDIIVGVSVPPIPKYTAQVEYDGQDGPEYTYLSSASHVARGILGDAISNLAVYLYGSGKPLRIEQSERSLITKEKEDEISFSINELKGLNRDLAEAIIEASGHIRNELVRPDNKGRKKVIGIDFLLSVMDALDNHVRTNLDGKNTCTYGGEYFIDFLVGFIKKQKHLSIAGYPHSYERDIRSALFLDIQKLNYMGLMEGRRRPAYIAGLKADIGMTRQHIYTTVHDRCISIRGRSYIRCVNLKQLYPEIWSQISAVQDSTQNELLEISSRFQEFINPKTLQEYGDFLKWLETDMIPRFKEKEACLLIFEPVAKGK